MGLDDVIRSGVALANTITADLQVTVTHEAWSSVAVVYGSGSFAAGVSRQAVVEQKDRLMRLPGGQEVLQRAVVTFVGPVTINVKDKITLPDGTTGPILTIKGVTDPSTGLPYAYEVALGDTGGKGGG